MPWRRERTQHSMTLNFWKRPFGVAQKQSSSPNLPAFGAHTLNTLCHFGLCHIKLQIRFFDIILHCITLHDITFYCSLLHYIILYDFMFFFILHSCVILYYIFLHPRKLVKVAMDLQWSALADDVPVPRLLKA